MEGDMGTERQRATTHLDRMVLKISVLQKIREE